jgi:hypothetical protein
MRDVQGFITDGSLDHGTRKGLAPTGNSTGLSSGTILTVAITKQQVPQVRSYQGCGFGVCRAWKSTAKTAKATSPWWSMNRKPTNFHFRADGTPQVWPVARGTVPLAVPLGLLLHFNFGTA